MNKSYFFGYGSLVNIHTHSYLPYEKANMAGWRRKWCYTKFRDTPFLSAHFVDHGQISGLIALVPNNDWSALDERENGYDRTKIPFYSDNNDGISEIQIYHVPDRNLSNYRSKKGIILSYLDCVIKGYLKQFGEEGVADFFETTDGWNCKIFNDRLNPIYPRHVELSPYERSLVDYYLKREKKK